MCVCVFVLSMDILQTNRAATNGLGTQWTINYTLAHKEATDRLIVFECSGANITLGPAQSNWPQHEMTTLNYHACEKAQMGHKDLQASKQAGSQQQQQQQKR